MTKLFSIQTPVIDRIVHAMNGHEDGGFLTARKSWIQPPADGPSSGAVTALLASVCCSFSRQMSSTISSTGYRDSISRSKAADAMRSFCSGVQANLRSDLAALLGPVECFDMRPLEPHHFERQAFRPRVLRGAVPLSQPTKCVTQIAHCERLEGYPDRYARDISWNLLRRMIARSPGKSSYKRIENAKPVLAAVDFQALAPGEPVVRLDDTSAPD